ncbi:unnamed protein product [Lactuca saligna]|uniref:Uncharacterized protein n=1 Tax=Lactuca saligna TaxID=75948 RepID=A0AA35YYE0_LACSI|nr:unnamed protein product [Lactuca saligna]
MSKRKLYLRNCHSLNQSLFLFLWCPMSKLDNLKPITSLFSSQSTEPLVIHEEAHTSSDDDKNVFGGTSGDIQFDIEELEIPGNFDSYGQTIQTLELEAQLFITNSSRWRRETFDLMDLKDIAKERHILFIQDVK